MAQQAGRLWCVSDSKLVPFVRSLHCRFKNQWPHIKVADEVLIIRDDGGKKCAAAA